MWICKLSYYGIREWRQDVEVLHKSSKLANEILMHNISKECGYANEERALPFKDKWIMEIKRQNIWPSVEFESGNNPCAQVSSNEKEVLTFERQRIKVILK